MIVLNMTADLRTFASAQVRKFTAEYAATLIDLIKVLVKFCYMTAMICVTVIITVAYPLFGCGLAIWAECGWSERLTVFQKIIFWIHVLGLTAIWLILFVKISAQFTSL